MCKVFLKFIILLLTVSLFAQTKPLYRLPEVLPQKQTADELPFLIGTDKGLFRLLPEGALIKIWKDIKVLQILHTDFEDSSGNKCSKWYFSTSKGIYYSTDLNEFISCSEGLPHSVIKEFDGKEKNLVKQVPLLKDLSVNPFDSNVLVTATKDNVYLTRDGGVNWKSLGSMSTRTSGIKACAVTNMPVYDEQNVIVGSELVVFMAHPLYGFSYYKPDDKKPKWTDITAGFEKMQTSSYPDEISDILPVLCQSSDGTVYSEIYAGQSFLPNLYRVNWKTKKAECIYRGKEPLETLDSLCQTGNSLTFVSTGNIKQFSFADSSVSLMPEKEFNNWRAELKRTKASVNAVFIPSSRTGIDNNLQLNEMWLLEPEKINSEITKNALDRKAVYIPASQVTTIEGIQKFRNILSKNKLNALVIDMKDDYGLLRFDSTDADVMKKARVSRYKINISQFVEEFKKDNVYLVARIVAFKDRNLANYGKKQYAVWDVKTNGPWVGIKSVEDVKDEEGNVVDTKTNYYDENWIDPYCEEVWEYNVAIARNLIELGFDEIQFDYIRFPTDGQNLANVKYRWRDAGMDKESAIVSFLSYARQNINAPIGIDIYGANGWYRTGSRTGQDVELLSEYVDVICPMFYPSHFEQGFLNYVPNAERPYRIYYYGTYRNTVIGRNKIIVRPWVQAFYLPVSYDKKYYNADYVRREVFGTRDSVNRGYMYWNNSGRYDDLVADPSIDEEYPWNAVEAGKEFKKPAFSSQFEDVEVKENKTDLQEEMVSVLNSVLYKELELEEDVPVKKRSKFFLQTPFIWKK